MKEPTVLKTSKRPLDLSNYRQRGARESDYATLITESTVVYDTEEEKVSVVYLELEEDCTDVVKVLRRTQYKRDGRTSGMISNSRTFGFLPRVTIRRDFCTATSLAHEDPEGHALVCEYAEKVARYYERFNPNLYAEHQKAVERVLPDYKVSNSVFTSGIINKDNPLPYHMDSGNFRNVWSNMLVFKRKIGGGYLSVPEYDVGFELKNNSLLMFDGQNIMHGVTPIHKRSKESYRFSVVFYSLKDMWNCLPIDEELIRIRRLRTEREKKRWESKHRDDSQEKLSPERSSTTDPTL